jgi:hypothetical protein
MRGLDSLTFDTTGLAHAQDQGNKRIWLAPNRDIYALMYFPVPPNIDAPLQDIGKVRARYREVAAQAGGAIVEVDVRPIDGCDVVIVLIKIPQKPTGMTYTALLTVPFRDFSYVVKVQCEETGMTGARDMAVFSELMRTGEIALDEKTGIAPGWMADPYDPSIAAVPARNRSEDAAYDSRFPDHPLSRARRALRRIEDTLRLSDELKSQARYGQ